MAVRFIAVLAAGMLCGMGHGQQTPATATAPAMQRDAAVDVAGSFVGRALFLRCFCAENNLSFDLQGKPPGNVKPVPWTLAGVNVTKVERKAPGVVELEGVRVAVRFVPDRKEFERHPQKDDKVKISVADTGDAKQMERTMAAIFSVGIDLPLQLSLPEYWRHYFDAKLAWPADDLSGVTLYAVGAGPLKPGFVAPTVTHRADSSYTEFAQRDKVRGSVQMRIVVDTHGVARHVAIAQPLGYGLDEKAVDAISKYKFSPATSEGVAVPSMVLVEEQYVPVTLPPH